MVLFLLLAAMTAVHHHGLLLADSEQKKSKEPIELGTRRELFVDDFLVASMQNAQLKPHRPEAQDVVLVCDKPWEGNTSAYYTLIKDGDLYRAWYRGSHYNTETKKAAHPEVTCYAESKDGIHWTKPSLGLFEFEGSKENNIVWAGEGTHNFTPFRDTNPQASPDALYKALAGGTMLVNGKKKACLNAFRSPDGIHWEMMAREVITDGAFDSQNLAFRDDVNGIYRAYWRYFTKGHTDENGWKPEGHRAIRTATSADFVKWEHQADLTYVDSPSEHLYTNAVRPYFRAPHLFVGFPTRFQPKTQQVEPVFMSSRDGILFKRWPEELIPITAPQDRDGNRSNYLTSALFPVAGETDTMSVFATEAYYEGPASRVRRFTFRTDGFVSVNAEKSGTLTTRPITFSGNQLHLNVHSRGQSRVEILDIDGNPVPGFEASRCEPVIANSIDQIVRWNSAEVSSLKGKVVQLRFLLNDADLFAIQFASGR
ncbi:MAG: hypothetical protein KDA81_19535 [Planctomycetaceae bacterium]|nr:hypothetical protein [Planctomycetaceae bacterium]